MDTTTTLRPAGTATEGQAPTASGVTLTIVGHPDPSRIGEMAAIELGPGRRLALSRREPQFAADGGPPRALEDPHLSRAPVYLSFEADGVPARGDAGAPTVRSLPGADGLAWYVALAGRIGLLIEPGLRRPAARERHGLVGVSAATERLRGQIERAGASELPVMLLGETGTGKELAARAIHRASARRGGALVAVNLAAIPESTAASQLFGHVRGAFTDAAAHDGFVAQAAGGTLFLDEIGETAPPLQVQLLRALEQREIQPIGGRVRTVDVRFIAATDADLEAAVAAGRFRQALLHRLRGLTVPLLPLRQRPADIALQLVHFVEASLAEVGRGDRLALRSWQDAPWLDLASVEHALAARWPGNSRELRAAAAEAAVLGADAPRMTVTAAAPRPVRPGPPERIDGPAIRSALARNDGSIRGAARTLGIAASTLYQRMHALGIPSAGELGDEAIAAAQAAGGDLEAQARRLGVSVRGLKRRIART